MRTQSPDTDPHAEQVQIDLLRVASPTKRFSIARALSRHVIALSRRTLREQMPDATDTDVLLKWVALTYGDDLSSRVRRYLVSR